MGHVTILVQHAWKIQNSNKQEAGIPSSYEIDRNARIGRVPTPPTDDHLPPKSLGAHIRVTVPSSIAQLVVYYNTCTSIKDRRECETACQDILYRLEHLLSASNVPDDQRKTLIKYELPKPYARTTNAKANRVDKHTQNTRKYASEARISVVMLIRCRSETIRDQAMFLLCEALDTNLVSACEHETMHLQMLWVELVQVLRQFIDDKRRDQEMDTPIPEEMSSNSDFDDSFDLRVEVDSFLVNLLMVLIAN